MRYYFSRGLFATPILILLSSWTISGLYFSGLDENNVDARETGTCSFYGAPGEIPPGAKTASGELFNRFAMRAAHKTLKFGTRVRVTNLVNKRTVDVIINDRGNFRPILDLTWGAFAKIGKHHDGIIKCSYDII